MENLKQYWPFNREEKPPAESSKKIKANQLPLYPENEKISDYRFIEDKPLPMQEGISGARIAVQDVYGQFMERYGTAQRMVNVGRDAIISANNYVKEEGTVLPKAAAITVGGMSGFLLGISRGGVLTRSFYSGLGMAVVAAFCYPHETVDLTRTSGRKLRTKWDEFKASPPAISDSPPETKKPEAKAPSEKASTDIDMYSTRSSKIQ